MPHRRTFGPSCVLPKYKLVLPTTSADDRGRVCGDEGPGELSPPPPIKSEGWVVGWGDLIQLILRSRSAKNLKGVLAQSAAKKIANNSRKSESPFPETCFFLCNRRKFEFTVNQNREKKFLIAPLPPLSFNILWTQRPTAHSPRVNLGGSGRIAPGGWGKGEGGDGAAAAHPGAVEEPQLAVAALLHRLQELPVRRVVLQHVLRRGGSGGVGGCGRERHPGLPRMPPYDL